MSQRRDRKQKQKRRSNAEFRSLMHQRYGRLLAVKIAQPSAAQWKFTQANVEEFLEMNSDTLGQTIVDRVDEELLVKGFTARQLAMRVGISNRSYQYSWWWSMRRRILEGRFNPKLHTLSKVAKALGLQLWDLFEEFK